MNSLKPIGLDVKSIICSSCPMDWTLQKSIKSVWYMNGDLSQEIIPKMPAGDMLMASISYAF